MAFPILHTVHPFRVALDQLALEIVVSQSGKYLLHDFRDAQVLEDLAVAGQGQEPEPGHDLGAVGGESLRTSELGEAADHAVNESLGSIHRFYRHRYGGPEYVRCGNRISLREQ